MDGFFVQHRIIFPIIRGIFDFSLSNFSLAIIGLPLILVILFKLAILNSTYKPRYFQNLVEWIYDQLADVFKSYLGNEGAKYIPFLFCLTLFIFIINFGNLVPKIFACTTQLSVTVTLAMLVFILVTSIGFYEHGLKFWKFFIPSGIPLVLKPFLFILEVFSFFMRPLSLALRLGINMLAGHIALHVIAGFSKGFGNFKIFAILISAVLSIFEIGVAALQAYVFAVLSSIYIADVLKNHHDEKGVN